MYLPVVMQEKLKYHFQNESFLCQPSGHVSHPQQVCSSIFEVEPGVVTDYLQASKKRNIFAVLATLCVLWRQKSGLKSICTVLDVHFDELSYRLLREDVNCTKQKGESQEDSAMAFIPSLK